MELTADLFQREMEEALKSFDRHIVCLEKTPDECREAMRRLLAKAIRAYLDREPHLRHGIALDRHLTIILSQTDGERPVCGIYFNLHSPYSRREREPTP